MSEDGTRAGTSVGGRGRSLNRAERIRRSPQWRGRAFANTHPVSAGFKPGVPRPSLCELLSTGRRLPAGPLPLVDPLPVWRRVPDSGLRLTRLGHSTLLIEIDGARILTDPVWGERVSPLSFAGPKRFHPPPAALDALPPLDAVIISHDHYDHLDRPTIRVLARGDVTFITSLGVGALLEQWGVAPERITELDWWESHTVRGVTVSAAPAQHFSGRGLGDRNATLWSSFHLAGPRHSFYYGADSGLTDEFETIRARWGPVDALALEIGAYHPAWGDIHLGPDHAIAVAGLFGAPMLPIHWGTFNLAVHPWDQPVDRVVELAEARNVPLMIPRFGEPVEPLAAPPVEPWWRAVPTRVEDPPVSAPLDGEDEPAD
jgi:L-ascorbate metabolism protein UlaG (beta-lactamase superfamily)